jgi:hypothetical protein
MARAAQEGMSLAQPYAQFASASAGFVRDALASGQ